MNELLKHLVSIAFFGSILLSCSTRVNERTIALQPYSSFDTALVDSVQASIEQTFGCAVVVLPQKSIPKSSFVNIKSPRYRADSIIQILRREMDANYDHIVGLTNKDISTTKRDAFGNILEPTSRYEDWGVFGLGFRPGESCVVSTFRLNTSDPKLLIERLKKVCNHELGHNLGLAHCTSGDKCVMKDAAESIKTVDHVDLILCGDCQSKIE